MTSYVFRRLELKYLLDEPQRRALEEVLRENMLPDEYGLTTICNLYYDTPDRRIVRRSLEKPVYKEKLRLRSYGTARPESPVFLEMKKKYKGVVYKRRVSMTTAEAMAYLNDPNAALDRGQIGREIDYLRQFYGRLRPEMYLSYQRLSWHAPRGDLRVTLDWDIRYRQDGLDLTLPPSGRQLLEPGQAVLEIKTAGAMPLWLVDILSGRRIRPYSFSKYGMAYMQLLDEKIEEKKGAFHA